MYSLQGFYDGTTFQTLEKVSVQKNQKVIITVLDDFQEEKTSSKNSKAFASLSKYANPSLWNEEKTAWENSVKDL